MSAPLLELQGVSKHYGRGDALVKALDGVDFSVERGEFVSVMGASGSGKSTALNILGCLDVPTSGAYRFDGLDMTVLSDDQRAVVRREALGFVFQGFNLLARTSARENVELPLMYRGVPKRARKAAALAALEAVGLAGRANHTPAELSGGQQQRVAIARALVTEPSLLLADEPTGNLDSERTLEVMQLLVSLNQTQGITIVMVTHENDVAAFTHRIVTFKDGRILSDRSQEAA
jgi:putative ABC transport system ATP-binding protein